MYCPQSAFSDELHKERPRQGVCRFLPAEDHGNVCHSRRRLFRSGFFQGALLSRSNGKPCPLRGVSRHQDRPGIGNALTEKEHREDMDLICELGANTIRLAHYQHSRVFYDLCDERGMAVWAEIPYISRHMPGGRENTVSQMKELIYQNINHRKR